MKINWFSPLPPAHTEIAHYSARIMSALSKKFDVVLWTDQEEWDKTLEDIAPVRRYSLNAVPWGELNRADVTVYHIGNNPLYHGAIWQMCRQHPGIVVLHDMVLQGFLSNYLPLVSGELPSYLSLMEECYGATGKAAAEAVLRGEQSCDMLAHEFPLFEPAVAACLGIIVHSATAFNAIARRRKWPVFQLDLPYKEFILHTSADAPARRREPPFHIIVFGYIGANRRVDAILEALSTLPRKDAFILDVYGEIFIDDLLPERLDQLGLSHIVRIHGYVEEHELDAALSGADLAINLRFPSFGEASSSQLRIWAHGLPTIVTKTGWYADQSEDALIFVDPENMVAGLQGICNAFLDNHERFAGMGEVGRDILLQRHLPDVYASALLEVFTGLDRMKSHAAVNLLIRRSADKISSLCGEMSAGVYSGRVAKELHNAFSGSESGTAR